MPKFLVVKMPREQHAALVTFLECQKELPTTVQVAFQTLVDTQEEQEVVEWETFDFTKFIRQLFHLERRLPFIAIGHLVNNVLKENNCGVDHLENKRRLVEYALDDRIIIVESVDGQKTSNKITAVKLNPEHPLVSNVLSKFPE